MALHMERLAAPAGGMGAQRPYLPHSSSALAAPRHPGKYVLESLLEGSEDEDEDDLSQQSQQLQPQQQRHEQRQEGDSGQGGWGPSPPEPATTPSSFQPARYPGSANHHITHLSHAHHLGHSDRTSLDSGSGGEAQVQLQQEEDPQTLDRLERIREAPYPHRWPSRKRRRCRSLGYLAVHAPTLTEEEVVVRPSSVAALPLLAPAVGSSAAAPVHGAHAAVSPANGALNASLGARAFFPQVQVPRPAALAEAKRERQDGYQEPQRQPQPQQPQQQPLLQRAALAPPGKPPPPPAAAAPPPQRIAGAPRALQKPLQMASAATGTGGSKAGQLQRGGSGSQPSAKRTRTAGPAGAAAATGAGGGPAAAGRQAGRAATGSKPPGKPAYKPSPSPQPPVRRPSSVALDRQRSRSMPTPAQGGNGVPGAARLAAGPGAAAARPGSAAATAAAAGPRPGFQGPIPDGGDFPAGHVVWAKLPSYPWWPAQVQTPQANHLAIRHGANDLFVVFYGTADVSWVPRKDLKHFSPALPDYTKHAGVRNKGLQRAIDEAWVALGRPRPDVNGKPHDG